MAYFGPSGFTRLQDASGSVVVNDLLALHVQPRCSSLRASRLLSLACSLNTLLICLHPSSILPLSCSIPHIICTSELSVKDGNFPNQTLRLRLLLQGWYSALRQVQGHLLLQQDLPEGSLDQAQEALLCSQAYA